MLHNAIMKKREIFSQIKVAGTAVVRVDGRGFGKTLHKLKFSKPYDIRFAKCMADSTQDFFNKSGINPSLAYLFSDEVNLVFVHYLPFGGRLEKIDSVIPGFFSSALTINLGSSEPLSFDSRVSMIDTADVVAYISWRQEECWRNLMSSYAFYLLKDDGMTATEAAELLKGMKSEDLHELAWEHDINLAETPAWQRRGIMVYKEKFEKRARNPVTGEETTALRSSVVQDWELPLFNKEEGSSFIEEILKDPAA